MLQNLFVLVPNAHSKPGAGQCSSIGNATQNAQRMDELGRLMGDQQLIYTPGSPRQVDLAMEKISVKTIDFSQQDQTR